MSEAKKIYMVTTTDWDGFCNTWGSFSTRELAEAAMKLRSDEDWDEIEEMELDSLEAFHPEPPKSYKTMYVAKLKIIGDVLVSLDTAILLDREDGIQIYDTRGGHDDYITACSSVSQDHAIEMARAARAQWIKDHEGKLDYDPDWHLKDRFS